MGRHPSRDWSAVLTEAKGRNLSIGQVAREQGCPYGTVATAVERFDIRLRTDDRKRRWDGIRIHDRIHPIENKRDFPECTLGDLTQNERLSPILTEEPRVWVAPDCIYVMEEEGGAFCKVGISAGNDIYRRVRDLRSGNPRTLTIAFHLELGERARRIERMAHSALSARRAEGRRMTEWFAVSTAEAISAIHGAIAEDIQRDVNGEAA